MKNSGTRAGLMALYKRLARVMKQERRLYLTGGLFVLLSIGTTLSYPQLIRIIVDKGILGDRLDIITPLALGMAGLLVVESISITLLFQCFGRAARKNVESLRLQLLGHLMEQEIAFFDKENSSNLMARLMGDIAQINELLSRILPSALQQGVFLVAGTALVIQASPALALSLAIVWPPIAYGASKLGSRSRLAAQDLQTSESQVAQAALESLGNVRTVRAYAREKSEINRFSAFTKKSIRNAQKGIKAQARLDGFSKLSSEAAVIGGLWVGGQLILADLLTAGALISFILYAGLVARSTRSLSGFVGTALRIHGTTELIFSYLDRDTKMPLEGGATPVQTEGRIEFEDVRFHYEGEGSAEHPHGLQDVNLTIERGEEIAIVGPSGSGKSTLVQLATRFYDPDEGQVRFDGIDITLLDTSWLRTRVSYVSQDSSLFTRTLAENIRYSRDEATDEEISKAIETVGATSLVASQPLGYETEVGDRGSRLSGGQRQRIALARALVGEPAVLILDEATSALDAESEATIKDSLRKLSFAPTVIWIAHRLSTVVDVARVIVVDQGRIVADGSHVELMKTSEAYRDLVETQLVSE
ncbi:MAG TPA: ABC transporter ATP-binding protein [Myxococcales bacterium]|nr:ABC transporter ATP-binding protein [Myxococcales bacterium]HIL02334.1 ABC transporter ATP-binding protein [Myxococcales bacterium]